MSATWMRSGVRLFADQADTRAHSSRQHDGGGPTNRLFALLADVGLSLPSVTAITLLFRPIARARSLSLTLSISRCSFSSLPFARLGSFILASFRRGLRPCPLSDKFFDVFPPFSCRWLNMHRTFGSTRP